MTQQRLSLSSMIAAATAVVALGPSRMTASAAYGILRTMNRACNPFTRNTSEREDARAGHRGSQGCHAARTSFLWREQLPKCLCLMWAQGNSSASDQRNAERVTCRTLRASASLLPGLIAPNWGSSRAR